MKQGFTLIELMVVVLIVGILSAVALPQYEKAVEHSRATEALTLMAAISESAQRYYDQKDTWPNFTELDIDIPTNTTNCRSYGGKHFCLTVVPAGTKYTIVAKRQRSKNSHPLYTLQTEVTAGDSGYTVTRSCVTTDADDTTKASSYCNVITGGKNTNF